jgi:hypothetical protein
MTAQEHFDKHCDIENCEVCYLAWLYRRLINVLGQNSEQHKKLKLIADSLLENFYGPWRKAK